MSFGNQIQIGEFMHPYLDVEPGYKITYTITLKAKPTLMWCSNDSNTSEYAEENIDNQKCAC